MPWILLVENGGREHRLPLGTGTLLVGSSQEADLLLDHPTVSRRHAELTPEREEVRLRDLGSSNGTRIDGTPVAGLQRIVEGQRLHFGSLPCRLVHTTAGEIVPAVEFHDLDAEEATPRSGRDGGTLSVGSVRDFIGTALPVLVDRLEECLRCELSEDPAHHSLRLAQSAGRTLFDAFPCRFVTVVERCSDETDDGEAILFHTGEEKGPWDIQAAAGSIAVRASFTPGQHLDGLRPMVQLVARLLALGYRSSSDSPAPNPQAARGDEVPLPEPATLDPTMVRLYADARRVARGDVGVLINGESGTGKEVLARFIHACSPRSEKAWVALNCAALPQDLLEAELFGIERGVATGVDARAGRFEIADGGTLFLDEIGDMAPATQAKILRVLQEGESYRIGAQDPRPARVRVIAATNRDLERMIADGDFRLDLYHRIADCRFELPPLRRRLVDLPNLAAHFLVQEAAKMEIRLRGISQAALDTMLTFPWPGNVRQLSREMARASLFLEDGDLLGTRHLHPEILGTEDRGQHSPETLKSRLEAFERQIVLETLARHGRNIRSASRELGIGRTTLYRRLQELDIEL